jgi:predicted GNAT family acetyltransferase
VRRAQALSGGDIKLHVEYDNPRATTLYERLGFTSKYAEMRWTHEPCHHQS